MYVEAQVPADERHLEIVTGRRRGWTPIAVLLPDQGPMTDRFLDLAAERRWQLIAIGATAGLVRPEHGRPAGAVVNHLPTVAAPQRLLGEGIPTVRIGSWPHPLDAQMPAVIPGVEQAAQLAAEHFVERGFKHIAYVGRDPWALNECVYDAFAKHAASLGGECHLLQEPVRAIRAQTKSDADRLNLRRDHFLHWLEEVPKPVGLTTFSDFEAVLFMQWIIEAGLDVPRQVAVLGWGDRRLLCESAPVPMSSVALNTPGLADAAVELLADLLNGTTPEQTTVTVPPLGIVTRQSTDVLASADPHVSKALRFMWDHASDDLAVDTIVKHVGVSRRTLERAFKRELGRGLNEEFQRRRLEKARELLEQTDLSIGEIAQALGFSSQNYLYRTFRTTFGVTPSEHRNRRTRRSHGD